MEKQKRNARRDRISIANRNNELEPMVQAAEIERVIEAPANATYSRDSRGKISVLKWKAPTNGIAGLL